MVLGSRIRVRRGRTRGAALVLAAALALGPALTACSDDSGGDESSPPTPSSQEPGSHKPSSKVPTRSAPADAAAARKKIKENWQKFFDPAVPQKEKEQVLEDGTRMRPVLRSFNGDKRGGQVQANVTAVRFTSPGNAEVTYSLALKGATVLPGAKGTSVEQDGTWKVSVRTLCALVRLSGNASAPPGC
ncbi:hypothetical protein [Streptomyces sp. NPDC046939]|uniref:hypothetical protein n=1 Tax=Streptomyces sp. NPDC046939 TaxID=3155376 RepID=UPI00340D00CC